MTNKEFLSKAYTVWLHLCEFNTAKQTNSTNIVVVKNKQILKLTEKGIRLRRFRGKSWEEENLYEGSQKV